MSLFGPDDDTPPDPRPRKARGAAPPPPRPLPPAAPTWSIAPAPVVPQAPVAPPEPRPVVRPAPPISDVPAIVIPDADDVPAMRAWLHRQLAGETPLQVQGEPSVRPWRGVPAAWATHTQHGAFVREHLAVARAVAEGGEAPPWLRSRWLEHLAALTYASRSHRGRQRLSAAELSAAEQHDDLAPG